jgi:hypothetical protein
MAVKNIAVTDTLETFRTTFNDLAASDFGDIANLSGSISATNLVDAMNETISIATSTAGWTIVDSTSTSQIIGGGDNLRVLGTTNEIEAVVSATDTLTIGLPDAVSVTTSITAPTVSTGNLSLTNGSITDSSGAISFGNENLSTTGTLNAGAITGTSITGSGSTHTLGTIQISGNTISSTDSTRINIDDTFRANAFETQFGNLVIDELLGSDSTYYPRIRSLRGDKVVVFDASPVFNSTVVFEGSSADDFETLLTVINPTADRTIQIPDNSGVLITTGSNDSVTESMIAPDAIGQNELKSLVTLQILNSSGTVLKTIYGAGA